MKIGLVISFLCVFALFNLGFVSSPPVCANGEVVVGGNCVASIVCAANEVLVDGNCMDGILPYPPPDPYPAPEPRPILDPAVFGSVHFAGEAAGIPAISKIGGRPAVKAVKQTAWYWILFAWKDGEK